MSWQALVPGCFGTADRKFGQHPNDAERAKAMVKAAKAAGASRDDVKKEVVWDCYNHNTSKEHMDQQVMALGKFWPV